MSWKGPRSPAKRLHRLLSRATGPIFPFFEPGVATRSRLGMPILLGVFGLWTLVVAGIVFSQDGVPPVVGICPLLMTALCGYGAWSSYSRALRDRQMSAEDLLGGARPARVLEALERFRAATDVPLRIVVRQEFDLHTEAKAWFERLMAEGVLDARGVLFLFSVRTGGYAIGLGKALARQAPALHGMSYDIQGFHQQRYAEGLAACLDTLASQVGRIYPARPGGPRDWSDVLDIEPSEPGGRGARD